MSLESVAVFRKHLGPDLAKLADQHMQHEYAPGKCSEQLSDMRLTHF